MVAYFSGEHFFHNGYLAHFLPEHDEICYCLKTG